MLKLSNSNKTIVSNIFSLSILNALNMALPLVSIPYLIATIGSANYGAYSIAYTILQYVLLIGAYGFSYSTTKQIAQHRSDIDYVSKIFHSTIIARLLLTLIATVVLLFVVIYVYPKYLLLYLFGLGMVYGDILNPVWLFQGMEKMKYMTIVNAITKIIFTLLIFVFIRKPDDYIYVTLLNSLGFIVSGIISYLLAVRIFNIKKIRPTLEDIISQIKDASVVFFSSAFISLYNNSFVFILGLFLSESSIGIYATAEKIIKAAKSVIEPVSTALFPHAAKSFVGRTIKENINIIFSYAKKITIPLFMISIAVVLFAPLVCNIFLKSIASESIILLRVMSPLIVVGGLNYVFGVVGMINLGLQKEWFKTLFISSILALAVLLITASYCDYYSAVIAAIIAETLICIFSVIKLKKCSK